MPQSLKCVLLMLFLSSSTQDLACTERNLAMVPALLAVALAETMRMGLAGNTLETSYVEETRY